MGTRRYKPCIPRHQEALLPPRVEDYVGANNPVRILDLFVESLDLDALGFRHAGGGLGPGQPPFHPGPLLKLYLYGYVNRVHSSRRLERESRRNLETIWLIEGLRPGYRTIAEFRRINPAALKAACKDFVLTCKELDLLGGETVAIDGSFFNASAGEASVATKKTLEREAAQLERDIEEYHRLLEETDAREAHAPEGSGETPDLGAKLAQLQERQARKRALIAQLDASGETQISRTDPDARALRKRGQSLVGYNVQSGVDAKHKLIAHHEVTNDGNDQRQLARQAAAAKEALGADTLTAVADAGYFSEAELADCARNGIAVYVPVPDKYKAVEDQGRFSGADFEYRHADDVYGCPGGSTLRPQGRPQIKSGVQRTRYVSDPSVCAECPHNGRCLPEKTPRRQIYRSEHADLIDAHRARMADPQAQERMRERAALVEHPFGTLKRWFGWDHFLVRGRLKVSGEMSLMVLCYNLTRAANVLGFDALRDYFVQRQRKAPGRALAAIAG
jgi:transposase